MYSSLLLCSLLVPAALAQEPVASEHADASAHELVHSVRITDVIGELKRPSRVELTREATESDVRTRVMLDLQSSELEDVTLWLELRLDPTMDLIKVRLVDQEGKPLPTDETFPSTHSFTLPANSSQQLVLSWAEAVSDLAQPISVIVDGMGVLGGNEAVLLNAGQLEPVPAEYMSTSEVLTKEFLSRLPTGRSYQSAVGLTVGVQGGGSKNIHGEATRENTYMLDGANITGPGGGAFSVNFNFDRRDSLTDEIDQRTPDWYAPPTIPHTAPTWRHNTQWQNPPSHPVLLQRYDGRNR